MHRADAATRTPWARAVVRDGRITLNRWSPALMTGGPQRAILERLADTGAVLADLYSDVLDDGTEELIVGWVPAGAGDGAAADALVAWAELVGYVRVWLPDRVVDLAGALPAAGRAGTTCPTCGLRWEDESPEFWAMVRSDGHFPSNCPVCNGSIPEWEPVGPEPR